MILADPSAMRGCEKPRRYFLRLPSDDARRPKDQGDGERYGQMDTQQHTDLEKHSARLRKTGRRLRGGRT
jgi:hypothetical protein